MKFELSSKNFKLLYFQYKDTPYYYLAIFAVVIITSLLLLIYIVIPQTQQWFSIRSEVESTREKITTLTNNLHLVQQLNDEQLLSNFQTAYIALPPEKDYLGLIQAISAAAARSGVFVGDFQFQVGEVASQSAKPKNSAEQVIAIKLSLVNDITRAADFIREIYETIPLSEVTDVEGTTDATSITISFPYRSALSLSYNIAAPIVPLSSLNETQLRQLDEWKIKSQVFPQEEVPVGTDSATSQEPF